MKKCSVLFLLLISFLLGCSSDTKINSSESDFNNSGDKELDSLKDLVTKKLKYIMSSGETENLSLIKNKTELNIFLTEFWKKKDPDPQTLKNEYKEGYYSRIQAADKFFFERKPGSETERGRILLLYGYPADIVRDNLPSGPPILNDGSIIKSYEIWIYDKPAGSNAIRENIFSNIHPGQMLFVFADMIGFGEFDLIFSTEIGEKVDSRVFFSY